MPDWAVIVYQPDGGEVTAAVTRPGRVSILAGMNRRGCCLAAGDSGASLGIWARQELAGSDCNNEKNESGPCTITINRQNLSPTTIVFHPDRGLLCINRDQQESWAALDVGTGEWSEDCHRCGPITNPD